MSKTLTVFVLFLVAATAACERDNSYYCPNAPHHSCFALDATPDAPVPDAPPDVLPPCTGNQDCSGDTAVCDLGGTKMCVHCTANDHAACTGTMPTCLSDNVCRACTAHSQCDSKACLPDGSCGDDLSVAYVDPGGTGTICTSAMPCKKVSDALATTRPFVKFHGTTDEAVTIDNGRVVTFLADPGAKLTRGSGSGAILTVRDDRTSLNVYDLAISDAPNNMNGFGVLVQSGGTPSVSLTRVTIANNPGGGISVSGGILTLAQSVVRLNARAGVGAAGGVAVTSAQYHLTNNVIADNGSPVSLFGGVQLFQVATAGIHVFDFNTVAQNSAPAGVVAGVSCNVNTPLVLTNSIVYANGIGAQVDGTKCSWSYSDIDPMPVLGSNNITSDPLFVAPAEGNFHIQATSPARDAADPAATLAEDVDGDERPQGSGRDIGADEVRP